MSKKTTFVSFLLDETGSMQDIKNDTVGGFNAYVEKLRDSEVEILFSLVTFNSNATKRRYVADPIASVKPLTTDDYQPAAMTPLIDAAVKIIKATAEAVEQRDDAPSVVVVMQTDGHENVSVEYTSKDLAALIKEKSAAGWEFIFLGAGVDAFATAQEAGMDLSRDRVLSYGRGLSEQAFASIARNTADFARSQSTSSLGFSHEQRAAASDDHAARQVDPDGSEQSPDRAGKSSASVVSRVIQWGRRKRRERSAAT